MDKELADMCFYAQEYMRNEKMDYDDRLEVAHSTSYIISRFLSEYIQGDVKSDIMVADLVPNPNDNPYDKEQWEKIICKKIICILERVTKKTYLF